MNLKEGNREERQQRYARISADRLAVTNPEYSHAQLLTAALAVAGRNDPLRDMIVLREAGCLKALLTPESLAAWDLCLPALRASVPESTYRLWIEPLRVAGAKDDTLILAAPEGIRAWSERRYSHLFAEALRDLTDFQSVRFVSDGREA